ncbi:hypothetical protein B0T16DRAFT_320149 [Cercophora newfieldiana]|uniref:Uncharacterized protein n=1 Tax=Cercophora newfieldiana TaxID=92897 RepID=A0AA39YRL2_9PEZI|nr:hypothetical protein B0T16DRAFT_320149 [Cercophora newfieldiana]
MGGLIPLVLSSGNRASFMSSPTRMSFSPSPTTATYQPSHQRSASTGSTPILRPRPSKRLSHSAPVSLPVLPYTPAEWKRAIADVKRQHFTKRYRACAARCNEILDNIKDTTQVEPTYIIYLHFYAATSMELCARTLPPISPSRTSLLQQARTHFDRAASLVDTAETSMVTRTRTGSVSSSRSSSCHSPAGSISSRAATPDTRLSSPTNSVCSFEELAKPQTPTSAPSGKRVKKVSFSLPHEETIRIPEPLIRPDSPTLGFDDEYFHLGAARQELPEPPKSALKFQEVELPLHLPPVSETEPLQLIPEDDSFHMARSVDRYCENLSGLRAQLARHSASVDELLAEPKGSEGQAPRSLLLAAAETARASSRLSSISDSDDLRKVDRQARIERLRKNGWQRKRFDARRYEELCETVMSELA